MMNSWGVSSRRMGNVEGAEFGTCAGEDAVNHQLDEFQRCCLGAKVTRVANTVAAYGDAIVLRF